jgi:hypothetical protein
LKRKILANGWRSWRSLPIVWGIWLAADISYSFASDSSAAGAAIVLGAAVWNKQRSPVFEERIKHAINLYREDESRSSSSGGVGQHDQLANPLSPGICHPAWCRP